MHKAVVLGANYYIGLSIIRCLGEQKVPVVAIEYQEEGAYGLKSKYITEKYIAPHYKNDKEKFLEFLVDYAKKQNKKPILFPSADPYVEFIDFYLDELKEYYLINQEEKGLFTSLMDKNSLEKIAIKNGVLVPEVVRVDEENYLEKVENQIKFPCLVKPSDSPSFVSKFRQKLFKVSSKEELIASVNKAKENNIEVFIQRIIPGFDDHMHTYDAYLNKNSKVTHWMTCQKFRQYPINFGASVYTGQKYVPELHEIGSKFLENVGFKGFAEIEFKKDAESGNFYLIEVNVRTTNLNALIKDLGINMPYIAYKELIGESIGTKVIDYDTDRVFRYSYEDILSIIGYLKTKQLSIGEIVKSLRKAKTYAIYDSKDTEPHKEFIRILVNKALKKIRLS